MPSGRFKGEPTFDQNFVVVKAFIFMQAKVKANELPLDLREDLANYASYLIAIQTKKLSSLRLDRKLRSAPPKEFV